MNVSMSKILSAAYESVCLISTRLVIMPLLNADIMLKYKEKESIELVRR